MNRLLVLGRALASLVLVVAIVAAVPWFLVKVAPLHPPADLQAVKDALTQRDQNSSLFFGVLSFLAWIAWVMVVFSLVTEAIAALRGLQAPRLPAMGGIQRFAAYLIASIALATTATSANAATPLPVPSAAQPAATATSHAPAAPHSSPATAQRGADQGDRIHVVKRGESLWGIAEKELGDGDRYPEIYKDSRKLQQPSGVPDLDRPRVIHPGQRLLIEHDPAAPAQPKPGTDDAKPTAPSHPGTPSTTPAPSSTSSTSAEATPPTMSTPTAAPTTSPTATPTRPATPTSTPSVASPSTPVQALPQTHAAPAPELQENDSNSALQTLLYGGLAASGLVALLALKRTIQQRSRRPGHRIRMPETMSESEWTSRTAETPDDADLLDRAFRCLARNLAEADAALLPTLHGVTVSNGAIQLVLAEPFPDSLPTAPFRTVDELIWVLDRSALTPDDSPDVPAPYPGLVSLGMTDRRASVMVDLEQPGPIGLVGSTADTAEVLTAIAVELATSKWADHVDVLCVGLPAELPTALSSSRLKTVGTVSEAIAELHAHGTEVSKALIECELGTARQARLDQVAEPAWAPTILLSATPIALDDLQLLRVLGSNGGLGAVVQIAPEDADALGPLALDAAPSASVELRALPPIRLQRVPHEALVELVQDLVIASDTESVPAPHWHDVLPIPDDLRAAMVTGEPRGLSAVPDLEEPAPGLNVSGMPAVDVPVYVSETRGEEEEEAVLDLFPTIDRDPDAPYIRVLGRVEIVGRDLEDVEPGKRGPLVELAAYLALTETPSAEQVSRALGGPRGAWSQKTRVTNISKLRSWFGLDAQGRPYVPQQGSLRVYRLDESVRSDWKDFQELALRGLTSLTEGDPRSAERDLFAAFNLVQGRPFASANPERFVWAEFQRQEMVSSITDVAHVLAILLVDSARVNKAREVIAKALDTEPGSEILTRDLMSAEHRAGNKQGIIDAFERLMIMLHDLGLEPDLETTELRDLLLSGRATAEHLVGSANP